MGQKPVFHRAVVEKGYPGVNAHPLVSYMVHCFKFQEIERNPYLMLRSRLILSSMGGCVLNRLAMVFPDSGLTMNM